MHPVLFEIPTPYGALPVYSYGVMLGTSMIVAWYVVMRLGTSREGMAKEVMANCFIITAVVAIAGARFLYVLTNLDEFGDAASWFQLRSGGLVAYGGFLGGLLGSWVYLRIKKVSLLGWADVVAPTLGIGLGFTRVGCYLYGCDFGARLDPGAPGWLVNAGTFPHWPPGLEEGHGSPAWAHHVAEYDLSPLSDASLPVHPTQIYESVFGFVVFAAAMFLWQRRAFRGQVILAVTMMYGVWRFFIEYVRDDPERGFYFGFSTSQIISLALVPFAAFMYLELKKRGAPLPKVDAAHPNGLPQDASDEPPAEREPATDAPEAPPKKRRRQKKRKR